MAQRTAAASEIAPGGTLRAGAIGIRVMHGVAEPVGQFIADRLGVTYEPVVYSDPRDYAQSFGKGEWDIAMGARVLAPTDSADITPDVWLVDLLYLAAPGGDLTHIDQIDQPGRKIGAVLNSPSDRYLTGTLKSAELVCIPLSSNFTDEAIALLREGKIDALGADFGFIDSMVEIFTEARIIPGAYTSVRVAAALPKGLSEAAFATLVETLNEAKEAGIVQESIDQAGLQNGVRVAPSNSDD
jgi:polar amino acid transport system substrate-binding protein